MDYGFWSLIPPLAVIVLALISKNVFLSLLIGIFSGSLIISCHTAITAGNIFTGINEGLYSIIHSMIYSEENTIILISLLLIGAVFYLIKRSGGIDGFTETVAKKRALIKSEKGACFLTWLLGVIIFTSGSFSCLVTGSVAKPINDALKVPREKTAMIIHATAAPWCVLLPLRGWLTELTGYLTSGGISDGEAVSMILKSIPLNFFCILTVFGALAVCMFHLDIGPMKKAEKRMAELRELDQSETDEPIDDGNTEAPSAKSQAKNLIIPVIVFLVTILAMMIFTGEGNPIYGSESQSLLWGSVLSLLTIMILCIAEKAFTVSETVSELFKGMGTMLSIVTILLLGFTMGTIIKDLDTASYLVYLCRGFLSPSLLPLFTFILCMILSFATGSFVGTLSIMSVIAIPMAINAGISIPLVTAAVIGGSIFGDQCSPISDTTIMSCAASGCDIIDHVRSQLPYSIIYAIVSMILYVLLGFIL